MFLLFYVSTIIIRPPDGLLFCCCVVLTFELLSPRPILRGVRQQCIRGWILGLVWKICPLCHKLYIGQKVRNLALIFNLSKSSQFLNGATHLKSDTNLWSIDDWPMSCPNVIWVVPLNSEKNAARPRNCKKIYFLTNPRWQMAPKLVIFKSQ